MGRIWGSTELGWDGYGIGGIWGRTELGLKRLQTGIRWYKFLMGSGWDQRSFEGEAGVMNFISHL